MGRTYQKNYRRYDDDNDSERSGKHSKHANGKRTRGMKTLNTYDDEYDETYDFDYVDYDENENTK